MVEVEEQVLGVFLLNKALSLIETLSEDDFLILGNVFSTIKKLNADKKAINPVVVAKESEMHINEITRIINGVFTAAAIEENINILKKQSALRKFKSLIDEKTKLSEKDDIELILPDTIKQLQDIKITSNQKVETMRDTFYDYMKVLDERTKNKGNELYIDIPTFNIVTSGFHKKELSCIGARPGQGKTTFGLQITYSIAKKNKKVLFVSLEMAATQIAERYMARFSDIPHDNLRLGKIKDYQELHNVINIAGFKNIIIDTTTRTVEQLRFKIVNLKPDIIILDYIGLMRDSGKFESRRMEISSITRKLKLMTIDFNIPIIMLAQLGRSAQNKRPILSELRDSGSLEEDSDNVIFIHSLSDDEMRKDLRLEEDSINKYKRDQEFPSYLIIEKQRNGPTKIIPTVFRANKFVFEEMKRS